VVASSTVYCRRYILLVCVEKEKEPKREKWKNSAAWIAEKHGRRGADHANWNTDECFWKKGLLYQKLFIYILMSRSTFFCHFLFSPLPLFLFTLAYIDTGHFGFPLYNTAWPCEGPPVNGVFFFFILSKRGFFFFFFRPFSPFISFFFFFFFCASKNTP